MRRFLSILAVLALVCAASVTVASPAVSAAGEHQASYNDDTSRITMRSFEPNTAAYTIYVRSLLNLYVPARVGVIGGFGQLTVNVPAPAPGTGALYIVNFNLESNVYIFHPDEWGWDF
jgi:hypothetical protein